MNNNQLKQQQNCPHFKLDDWGVCTYQKEWEDDICKDNCLRDYDKNKSEE